MLSQIKPAGENERVFSFSTNTTARYPRPYCISEENTVFFNFICVQKTYTLMQFILVSNVQNDTWMSFWK